MKITELRYPSYSSFLPECESVIREHREELLAGATITVSFSPQGYNRHAIATIEPGNPRTFWIDQRFDPSRFSARLRAAAYALYMQGHFGQYELSHDSGVLAIRRVSPPME